MESLWAELQLVMYNLQTDSDQQGLSRTPLKWMRSSPACHWSTILRCDGLERNNVDGDKDIGYSRTTDYTPLQYDNLFWHEQLSLVRRCSMIYMISDTDAIVFYEYGFLLSKICFSNEICTHLSLFCVE